MLSRAVAPISRGCDHAGKILLPADSECVYRGRRRLGRELALLFFFFYARLEARWHRRLHLRFEGKTLGNWSTRPVGVLYASAANVPRFHSVAALGARLGETHGRHRRAVKQCGFPQAGLFSGICRWRIGNGNFSQQT